MLSDGLGSGIKACVLSTMTATMAMNFTAMNESILRTSTSIMNTLPKDMVERGQDALQALKLHFSELEQNYSDFLNVMEVHTDAED